LSVSRAIIEFLGENKSSKKKRKTDKGEIVAMRDKSQRDLSVNTIVFRLFILFLIIRGITVVGLVFIEDSMQAL
jgi:hypothetical protein